MMQDRNIPKIDWRSITQNGGGQGAANPYSQSANALIAALLGGEFSDLQSIQEPIYIDGPQGEQGGNWGEMLANFQGAENATPRPTTQQSSEQLGAIVDAAQAIGDSFGALNSGGEQKPMGNPKKPAYVTNINGQAQEDPSENIRQRLGWR